MTDLALTTTTLGERVRLYRNRANLTQRELAELVGVTAHTVGQWESDLFCPSIGSLRVLAARLDIRPGVLLDD